MLPRYIFKISDEAVSAFRKGLGSLTINKEPVHAAELGNGIFQIKLGHENLEDSTTVVAINGERCNLSSMGLMNTPIQDESGSYAYHVPNGIFIVYDPSDRQGRDYGTISTQDIAPTLLANFNIPRPGYMRPALKVA